MREPPRDDAQGSPHTRNPSLDLVTSELRACFNVCAPAATRSRPQWRLTTTIGDSDDFFHLERYHTSLSQAAPPARRCRCQPLCCSAR